MKLVFPQEKSYILVTNRFLTTGNLRRNRVTRLQSGMLQRSFDRLIILNLRTKQFIAN